MSKVGEHISAVEKKQLIALLVEYADAFFSFASSDLGRTSVLLLDTGNAVPVHLPPQ